MDVCIFKKINNNCCLIYLKFKTSRKKMNRTIVIQALQEAQSLIYDEMKCIECDLLYKQYTHTLESINLALDSLKEPNE